MTKAEPQLTSMEELLRLRDQCLENIEKERIYNLRNDAKLRAVYSSQSYDEFKDIVDAAHMTPISRKDKGNTRTKSRLWNSAARETGTDEEG